VKSSMLGMVMGEKWMLPWSIGGNPHGGKMFVGSLMRVNLVIGSTVDVSGF